MAAICESRNKVIEAIDLIKKGEIEQAEQALDVAEALLIGYEETKDGQQILDVLSILNNQIEQITIFISSIICLHRQRPHFSFLGLSKPFDSNNDLMKCKQ